jgi:hypothetical protein
MVMLFDIYLQSPVVIVYRAFLFASIKQEFAAGVPYKTSLL